MLNGVGINVVNVYVYAPQMGCSNEVKEEFWKQLDGETQGFAENERVMIGRDSNGHVL